mgnify:FL=1|jgi:hypothetical protein
MATDLFLNVPTQYVVLVFLPIVFCLIQLYTVINLNSAIQETEKKYNEVKKQNDALVNNILEMLHSFSDFNKHHTYIENKNIELLENLSTIIEKRG